jgi:hypothetical protein
MLRLVVLERTKYRKILSNKSFIKVQKLICQRHQPWWQRKADSQMPVLSQPKADSPTAFQGMDNWHLLIKSIKQSPSSEAEAHSTSHKKPLSYGTLNIINMFNKAQHETVIWTFHFFKIQFHVTTHICLDLPSTYISSGFLIKIFYGSHLHHTTQKIKVEFKLQNV